MFGKVSESMRVTTNFSELSKSPHSKIAFQSKADTCVFSFASIWPWPWPWPREFILYDEL